MGSSKNYPYASIHKNGYEFNLFVTERKGVALGVLTQPREPHQQHIAYLSRKLDVISRGGGGALPKSNWGSGFISTWRFKNN